MPRTLNLTGFQTGDALDISVTQGGITAGPFSVSAWNQVGSGIASIDASSGPGVEFEVTMATGANVAWMIDQNASRTDSQVIAGGGQDSGSEFVPAGTHNIIYDMTGATSGTYYAHAVLAAGGTVYTDSFSFTV